MGLFVYLVCILLLCILCGIDTSGKKQYCGKNVNLEDKSLRYPQGYIGKIHDIPIHRVHKNEKS